MRSSATPKPIGEKRYAMCSMPDRATSKSIRRICDGRSIRARAHQLEVLPVPHRRVYHMPITRDKWFCSRDDAFRGLVFRFRLGERKPSRFNAHTAFDDSHTPADAPPRRASRGLSRSSIKRASACLRAANEPYV